ncbi:MAG TPA: hypothetical protein VFR70_06930 [Flavobacterium sp.]|nr:hypothetical protein [Flavobacterium sp.]
MMNLRSEHTTFEIIKVLIENTLFDTIPSVAYQMGFNQASEPDLGFINVLGLTDFLVSEKMDEERIVGIVQSYLEGYADGFEEYSIIIQN